MEIKIIPDSFDTAIYNEIAANPVQSWQWGESKKALGIDIVRIGEFRGTKLKSVYQLTFHRIPYTNLTVGYLPRSEFPGKSAMEQLRRIGKEKNAIFIKIEPYVKRGDFKSPSDSHLLKSPHPLFPSWTQTLDLTPAEDELLKKFKPKTRYNIRIAQKKGVLVREDSTDKGFETFAGLYFETTKRQHYLGHNHRYHKTTWEYMKKGIAHILIAYYGNTPLAAYELFYLNKTFYYPYGGTSELYRNFMASNLLMWEAIRLGKSLGAQTFDMWGSLPPDYDQNDPWAGFTRFKEGYGTSFTELAGSYDAVINKPLYKLYNLAFKVRKHLLKRI